MSKAKSTELLTEVQKTCCVKNISISTDMKQSLFYSVITFQVLHYIHQWTNDSLQITYVDKVADLSNLYKKIILFDTREANYQFELITQLIKQQNYLVFFDPWEANLGYKILNDLLNDLPKDFPFAVITCTDDVRQNGPSINLNSFYFTTLSYPNRMRSENLTEKIFNGKDKLFTFSFLNGRARPYRKYIWHCLNDQKLLDRALWTWLNNSDTVQSLTEDTEETIPRQSLTKEYESPFVDIDAVNKFDWKKQRSFQQHANNSHWMEGHVVPNMYKNTYFSVVTESTTNFKPFLTEKIFKPILAGHPFIAVGSQGFYKELHNLGFKTFDCVIDESFDSAPDVKIRCDMIVEQIASLCNSDLYKFHKDVKNICVYNRNHYIDNQWTEWLKIHDKLKEFFANVVEDAHRTIL